MLDKVIFRVVIVILILCAMVLGWCVSIGIIFNRDVDYPQTVANSRQYYEAMDILRKELYDNTCDFTDEEFKQYVENDMDFHFYIYKETQLSNGYNGRAFPIIRTIFLDEDLTGYQYCQTFVHEVIHIKQCVANETYVCYETFKYLYEDEVLHNVGVAYGWKQLQNSYKGEYNIDEQVIYYLTQK